ncbi:MAG TPA: hypothetical protein VGR16_06760, partial [Thermomicrobiales bacterium]|nr:hypothetical protein [Thermomicrobiales bacterium]
VTVDYLAQAMPDISDGPGLAQFRVTFAIDAAVPAWHLPGMTLLTVESGVVHVTPLKAPIQAVDVGRSGQADRVENLTFDPDQAGRDAGVSLLPGDFIFAEMGGVISVRQERDEPAVMLVATVIGSGQPLVRFTSDPREPATPVPPMA